MRLGRLLVFGIATLIASWTPSIGKAQEDSPTDDCRIIIQIQQKEKPSVWKRLLGRQEEPRVLLDEQVIVKALPPVPAPEESFADFAFRAMERKVGTDAEKIQYISDLIELRKRGYEVDSNFEATLESWLVDSKGSLKLRWTALNALWNGDIATITDFGHHAFGVMPPPPRIPANGVRRRKRLIELTDSFAWEDRVLIIESLIASKKITLEPVDREKDRSFELRDDYLALAFETRISRELRTRFLRLAFGRQQVPEIFQVILDQRNMDDREAATWIRYFSKLEEGISADSIDLIRQFSLIVLGNPNLRGWGEQVVVPTLVRDYWRLVGKSLLFNSLRYSIRVVPYGTDDRSAINNLMTQMIRLSYNLSLNSPENRPHIDVLYSIYDNFDGNVYQWLDADLSNGKRKAKLELLEEIKYSVVHPFIDTSKLR